MRIGSITTSAEEMQEGLFGGVFLFILETLPALQERGLRPSWDLDTKHYGRIIPSVLEMVQPIDGDGPRRSLAEVREFDTYAMGDDFHSISKLWADYFRPAQAVVDAANRADPGLENSLGVHYRGGDKQRSRWDTNPIRREDFLGIVEDRIREDPAIDHCLVASDDAAFIDQARQRIGLPVTLLPAGSQHKVKSMGGSPTARAVAALRDCMLLSRCRAVIQTSSALPSFAKILRPDLDCRRCAASKWFGRVPYFPVAYIPVHEATNLATRAVIENAMLDDWSWQPEAAGVPRGVAHIRASSISRPPERHSGRLGRVRDWWDRVRGF